MSRYKNRELGSWKVILARLRCIETTWRGTRLSLVDHNTFTEAILLNAMVLHDLSNRHCGLGTLCDHINWAHTCASIDVDILAHFLTDAILLWRSLSEGFSHSRIACYNDFKHRLTTEYPFAGKFLSPVKGAIGCYIASPSPSTFYPVYQFLSFMTHLTLLDLDMSVELEDAYMKNEEMIAQHHIPERLLVQMNAIMKSWLTTFKVEESTFIPKHGPGSVAELTNDTSLYSKYRLLQPDMTIEYVFRKFAGLDVWSCVLFGRGVPTSRQSQIVFVPKSMKTKRVISKEPATLMYFQQGIDRCVRKYISKHAYLSQRLDLNDQSKQRSTALQASALRDRATVDLSAASDSISWYLVKRVFHDTALYPYLMALRSRSAKLPSGKVVEMGKYAPMGSALCFPIQSLIFACIAECAVRYVHMDTGIMDSRFRVYGDDIIIPEPCFQDLVLFLRWAGFRLNVTKTYSGTNRFRESCGCDAYDGVDVTCMKIGRRFSSRQVASRSPSVFAGTISMANMAYLYGFQLLRRYLVDKLVNDTRYTPMFSGSVNVGIYSPDPTNYRLPHRQNRDWQETEILAADVLTVQSQLSTLTWDRKRSIYREGSQLPQSEDIRYFEWLRRNYSRTHTPRFGCVTYYCSSHDAFSPDFRSEVAVGSARPYLTKLWVVPE